jgi:hypothetical protein
MESTMEMATRFSVLRIKDGPWIVVDRLDHRRRIASCIDPCAAEMIAALMNGDIEDAIARRDESLAERKRAA